MYSPKGELSERIATAIERWKTQGPSYIADHEKKCCRAAKEWFLSMDHSLLPEGNLVSGPRWIRERYSWGPSEWPLHWCRAIESETLDCGGLAALAREVFVSRGIVSFPVQLIQQFSDQDTHQWHRTWMRGYRPANWIIGNLVYHEACAVIDQGNRIRIWDPTECWWIGSKQSVGYATTLAICVDVLSDSAPSAILTWGHHSLRPNFWTVIVGEGHEC